MATANKLSYLLETKEKIRDSINNDISLIEEDTIFREYPNKINALSDTLKKYIPTDIKTGTNFQIKDAVPLNAKSLIIDGNSYQKTTKGINLFNYTRITTRANGLINTLNADESITSNGKITANYTNIIAKTDITDLLEDNQTYILFQSNPNPYVYIQLRKKNLSGSWEYLYNYSSETFSFDVDKDNYTNYEVGVQTCAVSYWGEEERTITQKYMLCKDTGEEIEWELYTGGMTSPNSNYQQAIEVIKNIIISNNDDNYSIDLQGNFIGKINAVKDTLDLEIGVLTKKIGKFNNYSGEIINTDYISTTGTLSEGATVYYILPEPYDIQLEPVKIKMYEGTNNIELTSNLETSMKLEYYKDYKLDTNDIEQNEIIE